MGRWFRKDKAGFARISRPCSPRLQYAWLNLTQLLGRYEYYRVQYCTYMLRTYAIHSPLLNASIPHVVSNNAVMFVAAQVQFSSYDSVCMNMSVIRSSVVDIRFSRCELCTCDI